MFLPISTLSDCKLAELQTGRLFLPCHAGSGSRFLIANHRSGLVGLRLDGDRFRFANTDTYGGQDGYTICETHFRVDTSSTSSAIDTALPLGCMVLQFEAAFIVGRDGEGQRHVVALGKGRYDPTAPRIAFLSWSIVFRDERDDVTLFGFDAAAVEAVATPSTAPGPTPPRLQD